MSESKAQRELRERLMDLADGADVDPSTLDALRDDPAALDEYLNLIVMQTLLADRVSGAQAVDRDPAAALPGIVAEPAAERAVAGRIEPARVLRSNATRWAGAALAAALLIAAAVVVVVMTTRPGGPGDAPAPAVVHVGVVTDVDGAEWLSAPVSAGERLPAGELAVESGAVMVTLDSGAELTLLGPARCRIDDPESAELTRGLLRAVTHPGFEVVTPGGRVTDLGTAFEVSVAESGDARVRVFDGRVRIAGASDAGAMTLSAAELATVHADGRLARLNVIEATIPLGALFDDGTDTPLADAVLTDTFRATAKVGDLGVERVVYGGQTPGAVQTIAPGIAIDLAATGWTDLTTHRPPTNSAVGPGGVDGGLRMLGVYPERQLEQTEAGVGMHANMLMTLDLDALRAAGSIAPQRVLRFVADRAGLNDSGVGRGSVRLAVIVSGADGPIDAVGVGTPLELKRTDTGWALVKQDRPDAEAHNDSDPAVRLTLPPSARYLTLISGSAGDNINSDHGVFLGARIE